MDKMLIKICFYFFNECFDEELGSKNFLRKNLDCRDKLLFITAADTVLEDRAFDACVRVMIGCSKQHCSSQILSSDVPAQGRIASRPAC